MPATKKAAQTGTSDNHHQRSRLPAFNIKVGNLGDDAQRCHHNRHLPGPKFLLMIDGNSDGFCLSFT